MGDRKMTNISYVQGIFNFSKKKFFNDKKKIRIFKSITKKFEDFLET